MLLGVCRSLSPAYLERMASLVVETLTARKRKKLINICADFSIKDLDDLIQSQAVQYYFNKDQIQEGFNFLNWYKDIYVLNP